MNVRKNGAWLAQTRVSDVEMDLLVDSGACASFINPDAFRRISERTELVLEPADHDFELADGSPLPVYGQFVASVNLGPFSTKHTFIVADLGSLAGIMGLDFLETHDIQTRFAHGHIKVEVDRKEVIIPLKRTGSARCSRVSCSRTISIPAGAEKVVKMVLPQGSNIKEGMVEPAASLARTGLLMARSLVKVEKGSIYVSVINVHERPLTLPRDKPIGILQPFSRLVSVIQEPPEQTPEQTPKDSEEEGPLLTRKDLPEHIRPVLDNTELSPEQESKVVRMVQKYLHVFPGPGGELGLTSLVKHTIDTGDHRPIKQAPRRQGWAREKEADNQLQDMIEKGIAEPSYSAWASPIVLVAKSDGTLRYCVDYRLLNDVTQKDSYPLPRIDETLEALSGSEWFCTSDLASGYWQVAMDEQDKAKTAFVTRRGLFQFTVMPFGLVNAPATFQRLMAMVFRGLQWEKMLIYLDDLIVFGKDFEETLSRLELVLSRLGQAGLKLKPKKCHWFQKSVKFLGHICSKEGIACDPEKVIAIKNWHEPNTIKEVRSFLGIVNYYRKFIPNCSAIMRPLTRLLHKKVKFHWSPDCTEAFNQLKEALMTSPILAYPTREDPFIVDTDASDFGIGGVLSQVQDGEERVICYSSHGLNPAQQRYCTTKRELLAVYTFVDQYRHYLIGSHFLIRTDHSSLTWLKNFKEAEGMLGRWLMKL